MDRIGQEEIFGPVLSIIPVDDYGAAMLALNQTRYGLSSSIFTRDVNQAFRAMRDFETGIVYVNAGTTGAEVAPAVRRLEGDRQRPPRGGSHRARHVHRVEVDLRRLLGAAPARPDRQPAGLIRRVVGLVAQSRLVGQRSRIGQRPLVAGLGLTVGSSLVGLVR